MHEAAHLHYTKEIPDDIVDDKLSHGLLNACEDVRIDRHNFDMLPNVRSFYEQSFKDNIRYREEIGVENIPFSKQVMHNAIYKALDYPEGMIMDEKVERFRRDNDIDNILESTVKAIEYKYWDTVKENIAKLMKIFGFDKLPKQPLDKEGQGGAGQGQGKSKCPACNGTGKKDEGDGEGQGAGEGESEGDGDQKCPVCGGTGELDNDMGPMGGSGSDGWGDGSVYGAAGEIENVVFRDITIQKFKELLNIKEIRKVEDGCKIDTDNLVAFMTGDIDGLFIEDTVIKRKNSKIMLVLDASGSMDAALLDDSRRKNVVAGCCQELVTMLDELHQVEGINVDWEVAAFTGSYYPLKKETWKSEYMKHSGGTNLLNAFVEAQDSLLKNQMLDGNKLIVLFSDGDVGVDQVDKMRERIIRHGQDIRCMIVGVGTDLEASFAKEVVGENIILAKEHADEILLNAVMTMLD